MDNNQPKFDGVLYCLKYQDHDYVLAGYNSKSLRPIDDYNDPLKTAQEKMSVLVLDEDSTAKWG